MASGQLRDPPRLSEDQLSAMYSKISRVISKAVMQHMRTAVLELEAPLQQLLEVALAGCMASHSDKGLETNRAANSTSVTRPRETPRQREARSRAQSASAPVGHRGPASDSRASPVGSPTQTPEPYENVPSPREAFAPANLDETDARTGIDKALPRVSHQQKRPESASDQPSAHQRVSCPEKMAAFDAVMSSNSSMAATWEASRALRLRTDKFRSAPVKGPGKESRTPHGGADIEVGSGEASSRSRGGDAVRQVTTRDFGDVSPSSTQFSQRAPFPPSDRGQRQERSRPQAAPISKMPLVMEGSEGTASSTASVGLDSRV